MVAGLRQGVPIECADFPTLTIRRPVDGTPPVTQAFGVRSVTGILHNGVDYGVSGVNIYSVLPGIVVRTRTDSWSHYGSDFSNADGRDGGYGNYVIVDHGTAFVDADGVTWRLSSMYGHIRPGTVAVSVGQWVVETTVLGINNSTGISTGDHLHWELRRGGGPAQIPFDGDRMDPAPFVYREIDELMGFTDEEKAFLHELFGNREQITYLDADHKQVVTDLPATLAALDGQASQAAGAVTSLQATVALHETRLRRHSDRLTYQGKWNARQDGRLKAVEDKSGVPTPPDTLGAPPEV